MKPRDSMVFIEEEEETLEQLTNDNQPMFDLDSDLKKTPLIKSRKQQANQLAQGPSKNQPYGGDEVPTRLVSEGMRSSYDECHKIAMTSSSTLY